MSDLRSALVSEFAEHIEYRSVPFICFDAVPLDVLAGAIFRQPIIVKTLLASVNVASRAVKRDLGIEFNPYKSSVDERTAYALAGYVKPMLPRELAVPALLLLDHFWWVDKEMRAAKGRWEREVRRHLNTLCAEGAFKKRMFDHPGGRFELDAAHPDTGPVRVGVDVKRFESSKDFHKRGDEITQKVSHLRDVHPDSLFFAVIYYPFPSLHEAVRSRYQDQGIDGIFFADETDKRLAEVARSILRHAQLPIVARSDSA